MQRSSRIKYRYIIAALAALVALPVGALALSFAVAPLSPAPVVLVRPPDAPPIALSGPAPGAEMSVTRIAHAGVLLDLGGFHVLTDPWFSEKTHYHPGEPLGMALDELPRLGAVVATHAHYDHFDIETFARYPHKDVPFFVGPGMAEAARAAGFTAVRELTPWESASVGPLTVTAAPGKHGIDEVTYVLQAHGMTVYFGGDTMLIPQLAEIRTRFPSIQLALLAVNGLHAVGTQVVMNAREAAELAGILGAEVAVPMHYAFQGSWFTDTFILKRDGSAEEFARAARTAAPDTQVRILPPGQALAITRRPAAPAIHASR